MKVKANQFWKNTGCDLERDAEYQASWTVVSPWIDVRIPSDPETGNLRNPILLRLFAFTKRFRAAPFLALIGCVDQRKETFIPLVRDRRFQVKRSGRLWVFANDAPFGWYYRNNKGELEFTVLKCSG